MPIDSESPPAVLRSAIDTKGVLKSAFAQFERLGRDRLEQAFLIGQILFEAKKQCVHGDWIPWLAENFPYGRQRASDFIRVFMERGKCHRATTFEEALRMIQEASTSAPERTCESPNPSDHTSERGDAWEPSDEQDESDFDKTASPGQAQHSAEQKLSGDRSSETIPSAPILCDRHKRVGPPSERFPCPECAELRAGKSLPKSDQAKSKEPKKSEVDRVSLVLQKLKDIDREVKQLAVGEYGTPLQRLARSFELEIKAEKKQHDPLVEEYETLVEWPPMSRMIDLFSKLQREIAT